MERIFKEIRDFYLTNKSNKRINLSFKYYTEHIFTGLNKRRLGALSDFVRNSRSDKLRVLDIACGGGITTCTSILYGGNAVGVDFDKHEISLADKFAKTYGYAAKFIVVDVMKSDSWLDNVDKLLNGKPNVIVLTYALHHFYSPEKLLQILSDKLSGNEIFIVNEEDPYSLLFIIKHILRGILQNDTAVEHQRGYRQWRGIFDSFGYKCTKPVYVPIFSFLGVNIRSWSFFFVASKTRK